MGPVRRWVVVGATVGVLTGCSLLASAPAPDPTHPPVVPASTASGVRAEPTVALPSVTLGPGPSSPPPTPVGAEESTSRIQGRFASASWDIVVPTFSAHPAAPQMNRRVSAAVDRVIDGVKAATRDDAGARRTLTGTGEATTNDGRTLQVQLEFTDDLAGTAHPSYSVVSVALGLDPIQPLRLSDIIENPPETMRFLRTQVVRVAKQRGDHVDKAGLAPDPANWSCWQSTPQGLRFCFQDYQLGGHGLREYTLPWPSVRMILTAYGERVLAPA